MKRTLNLVMAARTATSTVSAYNPEQHEPIHAVALVAAEQARRSSNTQHDIQPMTTTSWHCRKHAARGADEHPDRTPAEAGPRHASRRHPTPDAGELLARLERLAAKVSALEAENVRLRAEMGVLRRAQMDAPEASSGECSRRAFLRRGTLVAVAGLGAGVATSRFGVPGAQAAAAPFLCLGQSNTSGSPTTVSTPSGNALEGVGGGSTVPGGVELGGGAVLPSWAAGSDT